MDALRIMTSLLAGLCHHVKAPHFVKLQKHSGWPEVATPGEPSRSLLRVTAAGTDWEQTKEAMVTETLSPLFPIPTVLPLKAGKRRPIKVLPPSCKSLGT